MEHEFFLKDQLVIDWLTALRSGEFEQGKERLCQDGKYCCLGVLCEIAARQGLVTRKPVFSWGKPVITFDGASATLPPVLRDRLKLSPSGMLKDFKVGEFDTLAGLNDKGGLTFAQIADIIEAGHLNHDRF